MISQPDVVLVVEDQPENRYLTTLLLEQEGFNVRAVSNGEAALEAVKQGGLALVLLDLQLPDIEGVEVARQIRQLHSSAQLPIIAVSAFVLREDRRRALAMGCDGFVEKPIEADSFVIQVREIAGLIQS